MDLAFRTRDKARDKPRDKEQREKKEQESQKMQPKEQAGKLLAKPKAYKRTKEKSHQLTKPKVLLANPKLQQPNKPKNRQLTKPENFNLAKPESHQLTKPENHQPAKPDNLSTRQKAKPAEQRAQSTGQELQPAEQRAHLEKSKGELVEQNLKGGHKAQWDNILCATALKQLSKNELLAIDLSSFLLSHRLSYKGLSLEVSPSMFLEEGILPKRPENGFWFRVRFARSEGVLFLEESFFHNWFNEYGLDKSDIEIELVREIFLADIKDYTRAMNVSLTFDEGVKEHISGMAFRLMFRVMAEKEGELCVNGNLYAYFHTDLFCENVKTFISRLSAEQVLPALSDLPVILDLVADADIFHMKDLEGLDVGDVILLNGVSQNTKTPSQFLDTQNMPQAQNILQAQDMQTMRGELL